jgi:hypothetical protein
MVRTLARDLISDRQRGLGGVCTENRTIISACAQQKENRHDTGKPLRPSRRLGVRLVAMPLEKSKETSRQRRLRIGCNSTQFHFLEASEFFAHPQKEANSFNSRILFLW